LNLFDRGTARARVAQRQADIAIAETNFAQKRNSIRLGIEQAYSGYHSHKIQSLWFIRQKAEGKIRVYFTQLKIAFF
jgi:outer membrane protein TolC